MGKKETRSRFSRFNLVQTSCLLVKNPKISTNSLYLSVYLVDDSSYKRTDGTLHVCMFEVGACHVPLAGRDERVHEGERFDERDAIGVSRARRSISIPLEDQKPIEALSGAASSLL